MLTTYIYINKCHRYKQFHKKYVYTSDTSKTITNNQSNEYFSPSYKIIMVYNNA